MSSALAGLADTAEKYTGEALAFGLGFALANVLQPAAVALRQEAWSKDGAQILAVDPGTAAGIVAENVADEPWGAGEAKQYGVSADKFHRMLEEALNAPGVPELLTLWRRHLITQDDVVHGLRKSKLEPLWDAALLATKDVPLDPAVVALGIVRGLVPDPGILPVSPPTAQGAIPSFPVFQIDALTEAAAAGIDKERLSVMVGNMGRPASPDQAARAEWRGVIQHTDYLRAIAEGDVRNEWAEAIFEAMREIPTVREYVEGQLRGILSVDQMHAGAAKHGMSAADADLIFETVGRPLAVHQITTGLARGGEYGGTYDDIPEPYRDAVRRSNIRPEYAMLAYANRYTFPSYFVLKQLAADGAIDLAQLETLFLGLGWPPELAKAAADAYGVSAAPAADKHVTKAQTSLWTAMHKSYVDDLGGPDELTAGFAALAIPDAARTEILKLWDVERSLVRRTLTPAQIKKAFAEAVDNPATGAKWTRDDALTELLALGFSRDDAETFLEI